MKRRPKGMGSITYLGEGRRKPFVATLNKKCIGTFKSELSASTALLSTVMEKYKLLPQFINGDIEIKNRYIEFIYDLQQKNMLPECVLDFPDLTLYNDLIMNKLINEGLLVKSKHEILLSDSIPTFYEIWEKERDRLKDTRSTSWFNTMNTAAKHLKPIHDMRVNIIKANDIQKCFDIQMNIGSGESKLLNMKNICNIVYRHALKEKYITKDDDPTPYIEYISTAGKRVQRRVFTKQEILKLIEDQQDISKIILIFIFTGLRPSELLNINRDNIHIEERYMIGGIKTKAGMNRIIPIHDILIPIIQYFLINYDYKFLCYPRKAQYSYDTYREQFHDTMKNLGFDHQEPYDTRHTFATLAKTARVDEGVRRLILGHDRKDVTDKRYTHEPLEFLLEEINKIKVC